MYKNRKELLGMIRRYLAGKATAKEKEFLETYDEFFLKAHREQPDAGKEELGAELSAAIWSAIDRRETRRTRPLWPRIAAAASVLLLLGTGTYFLLHKKQPMQVAANDVAPFSKQAVLKTGHGKTLVLDSNAKGLLAKYVNANINQNATDQIAYSDNNETENQVIFDTLQVPAGGRPYHLKLSDGSAIIVNVASALRFPENFRKNNNKVELITGEAYFSIIHNANAPLTIKAKDQVIEDIGTEFNVNTYADEPDSRTTLIAGAVKVNHKLLIPGQQAIITPGSLTLAAANIKLVTAWKDGYFRFDNQDITSIMRELARWYNIRVTYEQPVTRERFTAKIARSKNISTVLQILEQTRHIHFKIEGREVTVLRK